LAADAAAEAALPAAFAADAALPAAAAAPLAADLEAARLIVLAEAERERLDIDRRRVEPIVYTTFRKFFYNNGILLITKLLLIIC
jgi:zona occludens toxin (predicted ATPase)